MQADFPLSDYGNAERLVKNHGTNLRHCNPFSRWYVWDNQRWREDETGEIIRCAKDTVRKIHEEINRIDLGQATDMASLNHLLAIRNKITRHALKSEENNELRAMIELAQSEKPLPVLPIELDADPFSFCVQNGVVDLRSGGLSGHERSALITKISPVSFNHKAKCPRWEQFLREIFAGDQDVIEYIQRAVGYSLTADVSEQALLFCYGTGANGKSTFMNVVSKIAGDYAQRAPKSLVQVDGRGDGKVPTDMARLKGVRLVACSELEEGKALAESVVKDLTGGDRLVARFMRQDFFEFDPTHKLWMLGNHRPEIRGTDYAIWRRIHLIPFTETFGPDRRDPELGNKLMRELPGILNWAIKGCLDWQKRRGLQPPKAVLNAVKEYRQAEDKMGQFLEDVCVSNTTYWVSSKNLYDAYKRWCESTGDRYITNKMFSGRLTDRGYKPQKSKGERGWVGLNLKEGAGKIFLPKQK